MNVLFLVLSGCGGPQASAPLSADHPAAASAAADAFCKVLQGARAPCRRDETVVHSGGDVITVSARTTRREEQLGMVSMDFAVTLAVTRGGSPGPAITTRAIAFGGGEEEALARGFHEWAVVYGAAVADALLAKPERPALRALSPDISTPKAPGFAVYRGFPVVRQGQGQGGVDQAKLFATAHKAAGPLAPDQWHSVAIEISRDLHGQEGHCALDGKPSKALCDAAWTYPWPGNGPMQVKQFYVLTPE